MNGRRKLGIHDAFHRYCIDHNINPDGDYAEDIKHVWTNAWHVSRRYHEKSHHKDGDNNEKGNEVPVSSLPAIPASDLGCS